MRFPIMTLFQPSPFERVREHADNVGECGPLFLKAVESYLKGDRDQFEMMKEEIRDAEAICDRLKQNIRAHLPSSLVLPVEKSLFFSFLKEADKVIDCIKNSLYWMSYADLSFPEDVAKDYLLLVKEVSDFVGFLPEMVSLAHKYFGTRYESDRQAIKNIVKEIRFRERESDELEKTIMVRLCADDEIPAKSFYLMLRLVETTGEIADHLENSADMMRAMITR